MNGWSLKSVRANRTKLKSNFGWLTSLRSQKFENQKNSASMHLTIVLAETSGIVIVYCGKMPSPKFGDFHILKQRQ